MSNRDTRIDELSKRFSQRAGAQGAKRSKRERKLRSILIDEDILQQFDDTHHQISNTFYPTKISKARFLEALMQCGLDNLEQVTTILESEPA